MATFNDVLRVLAAGDRRGMLSGDVANALWPQGPRWNKPHHGGPTGGQRAAAGLLGKLQRKGLVFGGRRLGEENHDDPRTWWRLTESGREHLNP